jgi:hypothetical protein
MISLSLARARARARALSLYVESRDIEISCRNFQAKFVQFLSEAKCAKSHQDTQTPPRVYVPQKPDWLGLGAVVSKISLISAEVADHGR